MKVILMVVSLMIGSSLMAGQAESDKLVMEAKQEAGEMSPKELKKLIDFEENVIVMDVREENQRAEGEIYTMTSVAMTRGNLEFDVLDKIKDKNALIVTYCRSGGRGALAAQTLKKLGYINATNLKGGLKGWAKVGYPIKTGLGMTLLTKEE